jgi:hypothetical protein
MFGYMLIKDFIILVAHITKDVYAFFINLKMFYLTEKSDVRRLDRRGCNNFRRLMEQDTSEEKPAFWTKRELM